MTLAFERADGGHLTALICCRIGLGQADDGYVQLFDADPAVKERNTGLESATSSLGIQTCFESKSLARFCCDFLNLQRLAESAFCHFVTAIEA